MASDPFHQYASFLIRMWYEGDPNQQARWHGELMHIQSGRLWKYSRVEDMLRFLKIQADDPSFLETMEGAEE